MQWHCRAECAGIGRVAVLSTGRARNAHLTPAGAPQHNAMDIQFIYRSMCDLHSQHTRIRVWAAFVRPAVSMRAAALADVLAAVTAYINSITAAGPDTQGSGYQRTIQDPAQAPPCTWFICSGWTC